jgi:hypothetical protein
MHLVMFDIRRLPDLRDTETIVAGLALAEIEERTRNG